MPFGQCGRATSRYSAKRRPGPVDARGHGAAGDVFRTLEIAHDEMPLFGAGAGARVKPQWPITTVVTPCQHEHEPERIPEHLRVHVRVAVDEAGVTT